MSIDMLVFGPAILFTLLTIFFGVVWFAQDSGKERARLIAEKTQFAHQFMTEQLSDPTRNEICQRMMADMSPHDIVEKIRITPVGETRSKWQAPEASFCAYCGRRHSSGAPAECAGCGAAVA